MYIGDKPPDDSWDWKTERRAHEYMTITRVMSEHYQSGNMHFDDDLYHKGKCYRLISLFKKCLCIGD